MRFELAEPNDLVELFTYLSDLHRTEIANFAALTGLGEEDFRNAIGAWADQHGAWVAKDRFGRVLCVWGARPTPGRPLTDSIFFLCTRAFFDRTGANLRAVRTYLAGARNPYRPVTVVTYSQHPKARKWARVLGFNNVLDDPSGGLRFTLA